MRLIRLTKLIKWNQWGLIIAASFIMMMIKDLSKHWSAQALKYLKKAFLFAKNVLLNFVGCNESIEMYFRTVTLNLAVLSIEFLKL